MATTMIDTTILEPVQRISRDVRDASRVMSDDEARFLVDTYYQVQEYRKATANQIRSMGDTGEPNAFIDWVFGMLEQIENQIKSGLNRYTDQHEIGRWAKSITGIGPVIAAGLMAHIEIEKAPSVAHIWRFAGLDPTTRWEKGEKRPWNADLKVLCWKVGESFNKQKNRKNDHYGHLIDARREYEWKRNIAGVYADQATGQLERKRIGKNTEAYAWYAGKYRLRPDDLAVALSGTNELKAILPERRDDDGVPMLPPGHILARSKRFAVKLFLAHYHAVAYELHHGRPSPQPYAIAHLGHVDEIPPYNWPQ